MLHSVQHDMTTYCWAKGQLFNEQKGVKPYERYTKRAPEL